MHLNGFEDLEQLVTPSSMNAFMQLVNNICDQISGGD